MCECTYILWTVCEQELMFFCRAQDAHDWSNAEHTVCIKMMLNAGGVWSLSRQQTLKVGFHDLPVVRELQVSTHKWKNDLQTHP